MLWAVFWKESLQEAGRPGCTSAAPQQCLFSDISSGDALEMLLQGAQHPLPFHGFLSRNAQQQHLPFACSREISFTEFTLPVLFIKLSFLVSSDEAVRMTLLAVCRDLKCTHFKSCSWEEWVVRLRHSMKNNMPGPNVKYNNGWY